MNESNIGKIKCLLLRDFLTYDEMKYIPSSHLNIIIGPNGTGKSTIAAGIILGCGGKPEVLSRSKNIADFVKNGKSRAKIELEIYSDHKNRTLVFNRSFDKDGKENFKIGGKNVSGKEYKKVIEKFNIQVDNLCMFLPQDRVQDFTKLNPQELLHNTQLSVCSDHINESFKKLLEIREAQKNNAKNNCAIQKCLDDNKRRNEQLKTLIENNKRKDEMIGKVNVMKAKQTWVELENVRKAFDDADKDLKLMNKKLAEKQAQLQPLINKQNKHADEKSKLRSAISKSKELLKVQIDQLDKFKQEMHENESQFNRAKQNLKNALDSINDHAAEVKKAEMMVKVSMREVEEAKKSCEEQGDINTKMSICDKDIAELRRNIQKLSEKRDVINSKIDSEIVPSIRNCERKISNLTDVNRQRVEKLRNVSEDVYRAYEWLQSNRQSFRGKIFNPPIVELTVTDIKYAKYIENSVSIRDLLSFICTDKEDFRRLFDRFRNQMKLHVNLAHVEDADEVQFHPPKDIKEYPEELGLDTYLVDVIRGPAPIINHLCKLYRLHTTAVGDDRTFHNAANVPNEFRVFFSTNHRFQCTISKYSGAKSSLSSEIQGKNFLNVGIDKTQIDREQRNIAKWQKDLQIKREQRVGFEEEIERVEAHITDVRKSKQQLQSLMQNVSICEDKLKRKKREFQELQSKEINAEAENKKFKNSVSVLIKKKLGIADKQILKLAEIKTCALSRVLAEKKLQIFDESNGNIDTQIVNFQHEIETTRSLLNRVKVTQETHKRQLDLKKAEIRELCDGNFPTDSKYKFKSMFEQITSNIGELQNLIEEMQGKIACLPGVNKATIKEYEERTREIANLEKQLKNEMQSLTNMEDMMEEIHSSWYPKISEIVESINQHFSQFFSKMGFVGEVELTRNAERDYAEYGIQIRVQYRENEKLQVLNRHVQSGGERAVAIAVYTLSLQHLTHVPFRCVDEINQGMDPKNERKIFQMLVDITCQPGQSQYFFVTPKLLPELPFHDLMSIHVVHNGADLEDPYLFINAHDEEDLDFNSENSEDSD